MAQLGADPDQLDGLARSMDMAARRLSAAADAMTGAVGAVWWQGTGADDFRSWWRRDGTPKLTGAVGWLHDLGADVRRQASAQRRASDAGGTGGSPFGPGGGHGGDPAGGANPDLQNDADHYQDFPRDEYGPYGPDGRGTPELDDIDQGGLGDCWFLAGLGAVVLKDPEWIRRHIVDHGDGTYTVTFYERTGEGEYREVEITVDGTFPVDADGNPAYDSPADTDETWAMIYEKAFAQWQGGYGDIEGGWGDDSMEAIYGREFDRLDPGDMSDDDLVWQLQQQPVTVGTKNPDKIGDVVLPWDRDLVDRFDDLDVVPAHVYTVKGVIERDGVQYVDLYNPWGHDHVQLTLDEFRDVFDEVDAPHYYYDPPPPGGWPSNPPGTVTV